MQVRSLFPRGTQPSLKSFTSPICVVCAVTTTVVLEQLCIRCCHLVCPSHRLPQLTPGWPPTWLLAPPGSRTGPSHDASQSAEMVIFLTPSVIVWMLLSLW